MLPSSARISAGLMLRPYWLSYSTTPELSSAPRAVTPSVFPRVREKIREVIAFASEHS